MTGKDAMLARPFAIIVNHTGKRVDLMIRQEWNSAQMGIFTCRGKDATGQLLDGKFVCYLKDWPRKKNEFQNAGIKIKEL
jgi:hypothetical protein